MRRVAVTGLGAVTPIGNDARSTWRAALAGESGIDWIRSFDPGDQPVRIAAEVKDFDPSQVASAKEVRKLERFVLLSLGAAREAIADAGLNGFDPMRVGIVFGSAIGGVNGILEQEEVRRERGAERVSPNFLPNVLVDSASGQLAISLGIKGPNYAVVSACATGSHAIGEAAEVIKRGDVDAVLAGGAEACVLVLEELEAARARGANVYAEVLGYGASNDAHHMAQPEPEASGVSEMMRAALRRADVEPERVGYINAHGTSTPLGDLAETKAIKEVFGQHAYELAVSSTKSMTGHCFGAAGAVEAIMCALALHERKLPPTINYEHRDPACDLDYVPNEAREAEIDVALSNAMGLGGHNACVLLGRV